MFMDYFLSIVVLGHGDGVIQETKEHLCQGRNNMPAAKGAFTCCYCDGSAELLHEKLQVSPETRNKEVTEVFNRQLLPDTTKMQVQRCSHKRGKIHYWDFNYSLQGQICHKYVCRRDKAHLVELCQTVKDIHQNIILHASLQSTELRSHLDKQPSLKAL